MSGKAQGRLDRGRYFAARAAHLLAGRVRRRASPARAQGRPVLLTSIPKAGTHLAERALDLIPGMDSRYLRTLRTAQGWDHVDRRTVAKVARLQPGTFAVAHLPPHPQVVAAAAAARARVVCVVRDPRAVLLSKADYLGDIDTTHPWHSRFSSLSPRERRSAVLEGVPGLVRPLAEGYERFAGWSEQGALTLRFEDLVGARGGGDDRTQRAVMTDLLRHIGVEVAVIDSVLGGVFNDKSLTFHSGQIDRWRGALDADEMLRTADLLAPWLELYGYPLS